MTRFFNIVFAVGTSICLIGVQVSAAQDGAQNGAAQERVPPTDTFKPAAPPLSELDILSQSDENQFGELIVQKRREPISVTLRALDKIIARTIEIEVPMNSVAKFGTLEIVPRTCDKRPPEDFPETSTFLEIFDTRAARDSGRKPIANGKPVIATPAPIAPIAEPTNLADALPGPKTDGTRIFSGWMFASSPGLNALEHAVYDVWVIDCNTRLVDQSASKEEPSGN